MISSEKLIELKLRQHQYQLLYPNTWYTHHAPQLAWECKCTDNNQLLIIDFSPTYITANSTKLTFMY